MIEFYNSIREIPYEIEKSESDLPVRKDLAEYIYKVKNGIKLLSELKHDDLNEVNPKDISLVKKNKLAYFDHNDNFFICSTKNKKILKALVADHWPPRSKKEHMIFGCLFGYTVKDIISYLKRLPNNFKATKKEVIDCYKTHAFEVYKNLLQK